MKFSKLFLGFLILAAGNGVLALESQKAVVSQNDQNQKLWLPQAQWKPVLDRIDASDEVFATLAARIYQMGKLTNAFAEAGIDITDSIIKERAKASCKYTLIMMFVVHVTQKYSQIDPVTKKNILEPTIVDCLLTDTPIAQSKLKKIVADSMGQINFAEEISQNPFFLPMFVKLMDNSKHDGYFVPDFDQVLPYYLS